MYSSKLEDIMVECSLLLVVTQLSLEHSEPALSSQFHSFFCAFVFSKLFTLVSNYYGFSTNQQKNILVISSNCVLQHLFILIDFFFPLVLGERYSQRNFYSCWSHGRNTVYPIHLYTAAHETCGATKYQQTSIIFIYLRRMGSTPLLRAQWSSTPF